MPDDNRPDTNEHGPAFSEDVPDEEWTSWLLFEAWKIGYVDEATLSL